MLSAWANLASVQAQFRETFTLERLESLQEGCTEEVAFDRGQIAAWLDNYALNRRLRVERSFHNGIVQHRVEFMEENRLAFPLECGGWAALENYDWALHKQPLDGGWVRIEVMISNIFPNHEIFKRADGSPINLGYNGVNYYTFLVDMHPDDLWTF